MTEDASHANQTSANPEFTLGQIVTPIATPSINGAIIQVISSSPENRFVVFLNGKLATYYASQLKAVELQSDSRNISPLTDFHAYLSALQLRHPGISNLYSLNAARVDYIPYQFKPVMKLIRSDRPRLLIAESST